MSLIRRGGGCPSPVSKHYYSQSNCTAAWWSRMQSQQICNTPELWKNHLHPRRLLKTSFPSCLSQTNDHWADISLDEIIFHLSRPMCRTTWAAAVLSEIPEQNKHKNTLLWVPIRKSIAIALTVLDGSSFLWKQMGVVETPLFHKKLVSLLPPAHK